MNVVASLLLTLLCLGLMSAPSMAIEPKFEITDQGLKLEGVTADNPIVYDNDWWTDIPDAAYLWSKASLGQCKLQGNIITRDTFGWKEGYAHKLATQVADCDKLWKAATAIGLKNIPKPILGAETALRKPESGKVSDTKFVKSAGSSLIVEEARKATAAKPLLLFCGGPCTTIATAYLMDPSIAEKVIVFQIDGGNYNGSDAWAWEITQKQFRFANWARGYFWNDINRWDASPFEKLPDNALGQLLRDYAQSDLAKANQWGDGAWIFYLFDHRCISKAEAYDKIAITVPEGGTNFERIRDEFLTTLTSADERK